MELRSSSIGFHQPQDGPQAATAKKIWLLIDAVSRDKGAPEYDEAPLYVRSNIGRMAQGLTSPPCSHGRTVVVLAA